MFLDDEPTTDDTMPAATSEEVETPTEGAEVEAPADAEVAA